MAVVAVVLCELKYGRSHLLNVEEFRGVVDTLSVWEVRIKFHVFIVLGLYIDCYTVWLVLPFSLPAYPGYRGKAAVKQV